jgi:hypothetical protein
LALPTSAFFFQGEQCAAGGKKYIVREKVDGLSEDALVGGVNGRQVMRQLRPELLY